MTSDPGNWIWSNDERLAGRPGVPEPVPCEFCGALRYHKGIPLGDRILWPPYGAERCTCPEAVAAYEKEKAEREAAEAAAAKAEEEQKMRERIKRIVGESGMGDRFLRRTFSTFQLTTTTSAQRQPPGATPKASTPCCRSPAVRSPAATACLSLARRAPARPTSPLPSPTT